MDNVHTSRWHAREYLIEAWALGTFMWMACAAVTLVSVAAASWPPLSARAVIGVAMGLTALMLIRSPWGQRSGAHMNPAVTLCYWLLGRMRGHDALAYIIAQFAGGTAGVAIAGWIFGDALAAPTVDFVATTPGTTGPMTALLAEMAISAFLMFIVLELSADEKRAGWTPFAAAVLVALYITFEAPLSGMSMNPARSFASATAAGHWQTLWIYFVGPPLGMAAAALLQRRRGRAGHCAKFLHTDSQPCIHCGHRPPSSVSSSGACNHAY